MTEVPDGPLEPPEVPVPRRWCNRCCNWADCPCGCGWGLCLIADEFTQPDITDECGDFEGEPPEMDDDPAWDSVREEGNDYDR